MLWVEKGWAEHRQEASKADSDRVITKGKKGMEIKSDSPGKATRMEESTKITGRMIKKEYIYLYLSAQSCFYNCTGNMPKPNTLTSYFKNVIFQYVC